MLIQNNSLSKKLFAFAYAKGFRNIETHKDFLWKKNRAEHFGTALRWGVGHVADVLLKEIKNPIMIVGLTSLALLGVTIAFYPGTLLAVTAKVFPIAFKVKPWMVKMALYILVQTTIAGVGIRTFGRLSNETLVREWDSGRLRAIHLGEKEE